MRMTKVSAPLIISCSVTFKGNTHGSNQPQGILNGKQVYLMQPLMGGEPLCFDVPASPGPMRKDGMNILASSQTLFWPVTHSFLNIKSLCEEGYYVLLPKFTIS